MTGTEIRTEDSPVIIALIWPARPAQGSLNLTPPDSLTGRVEAGRSPLPEAAARALLPCSGDVGTHARAQDDRGQCDVGVSPVGPPDFTL